jgi:hypothetical protein
MTDTVSQVGQEIDRVYAHESASTRRKFVAATGAMLGGMGLLATAGRAEAQRGFTAPNNPETILAVGSTAEALATIINTVGPERIALDATTKANVNAAARHELLHYGVWTSDTFKGKPVTTRFWIPNAVFASKESFLGTLVVGDTVFVNAYLLATSVLARQGGNTGGKLARIASEFMAVESVHRALALQSLGLLGNDRAYAKFPQREEVKGLPTTGAPGFYKITDAVTVLESAGIGFGKEGQGPGAFYEFADVSKRTPDPAGVSTRTPN